MVRAFGETLARYWYLTAAVVAVAAYVSFWPKAGDTTAAKLEAAPSMTITTASAERADWPVAVAADGAILPWQEAIIGARVSGLALVEVTADVGDKVKKNQVLARFDAATVRAQIAQAEASLAQAKASAAQAAANKTRALKLKSTGFVSDQSVLQSTTAADTAAAQVNFAQAALNTSRLQLAYTEVLAPDDGVISARNATLGSVLQAGGELFRLIRQERLEWRGELTAEQLANVKEGQTATITLPGGTTATGTLRQIAPSLSGESRLGTVYVALKPGGTAKPGMFASGRIKTGSLAAITVPGEAIVIRDGRSFVFRIAGDKAERLAVTPGDLVAVRGAGFLNDGDIVRVSGGDRPVTPGASAQNETPAVGAAP
jgi:RND family efflux transporter MFP subunit